MSTQRPNPVPPPRRVVVVGGVTAEVVMAVSEPPERGGASRAQDALARAGGGYPVLAAARRARLDAALAGVIGTGAMARLVGRALRREGIRVLLPDRPGEQGFSVVFTEEAGRPTRVAAPGVEATLNADDLARVRLAADDVAYISAQDLIDPVCGPAIAQWCGSGLGEALLVLDPGPLVSDVPDDVLDAVLARTDVLALGRHELELLSGRRVASRGDTGEGGARRDGEALAALAGLLADEAIVLLRSADGYLLREHDGSTYSFPGDEPGPPRLRHVAHLLGHLAQVRASQPALTLGGVTPGQHVAALLLPD